MEDKSVLGRLLVLTVLFSPLVAWSQSRTHANEDYLQTWVLAFGADYTTNTINHNETSSSSNYTAVDREISVNDITLNFMVMKEFFNPQKISMTVKFFAGKSDSTGKSGDKEQVRYEEKLTKQQYGLGLSLNYNTYAYGLKLQYYAGVDLMNSSGQFSLSHSNAGYSLQTLHDVDAQLALLNLGIRIFDANAQLMSFFQISTPQVLSETIKVSGTVDGSAVTMTNSQKLTRAPWALSIGFGYYF